MAGLTRADCDALDEAQRCCYIEAGAGLHKPEGGRGEHARAVELEDGRRVAVRVSVEMRFEPANGAEVLWADEGQDGLLGADPDAARRVLERRRAGEARDGQGG